MARAYKKRSCWIEWISGYEPAGGEGVVAIRRCRKVIHFVKVTGMDGYTRRGAAKIWWDAERACKKWAAGEGFEYVKELLHR